MDDELLCKIIQGENILFAVRKTIGEFVDGGILEQMQFRVNNTPVGYDFHIHLDSLAWIGHLLVRFGFICFFLLCRWEQPQLVHPPKQAFWAAGIAPQPQLVPQRRRAKIRIAATHIPDQLELCLCMLVGMAVGPPGLAGQRSHRSVPAGLSEVEVRPALVVFPASTADAVFLRVFHKGLPVCHILCYTLAHEGYGLLSYSCCSQLQL